MASERPQRRALVLSCEVPGEDPLPGARQNAGKLSKFFRRAHILAQCAYGGTLRFDGVMEELEDFFSSKCDLHILYGIFHGHAGSWKLSDGRLLGLDDILQQWDLAKQQGTAKYLLIVSDSCESGHMRNEAVRLGRKDMAVQASCAEGYTSFDNVGETFTELLLWKLQGQSLKRERDRRIRDNERPVLDVGQPCYHCPDLSNYRGWIFVDHNESDQSLSPCFSLETDSSDMISQGSLPSEPEDASSPRSASEENEDASSWSMTPSSWLMTPFEASLAVLATNVAVKLIMWWFW